MIFKKEKKEVKKEAKTKKTVTAPKKFSHEVRYLVRRPWISEKSTALREAGTYVFLVEDRAGKKEIAEEIKARYGVGVEQVRVIRKEGKIKRFGRGSARRSDMKKALVTLRKGESIEII